jgi:hypothetical protein
MNKERREKSPKVLRRMISREHFMRLAVVCLLAASVFSFTGSAQGPVGVIKGKKFD